MIDHTHDPRARSWIESANINGDFPIQNLPFGVFRVTGRREPFRCGVAIGDQIVDLSALAMAPGLDDEFASEPVLKALAASNGPSLNPLFDTGPMAWRALRHALFAALESGATAQLRTLFESCLVPQADAEYTVPATIGDYTDFYTSIDHALNVGRIFRPGDPLSPNFKWMPIAYHGRVSSIGVSGSAVRRPRGQFLQPGADRPVQAATQRLDYEMELGFYIGKGNAQGEPIALANAADHVFGMCLLNDWSARDIQRWETTPLGPFLGKNFATSVSPWVVTMDALAPYRQAAARGAGEPPLLPHLDDARDRREGAFDITLEVSIETRRTASRGRAGERISSTSFRHQYWTMAQMVAHHTEGGCNLRSGDLLGSGTISGPSEGEAGCLLELTQGGAKPLLLAGDEQRAFLEDGDTIVMTGWCAKPDRARIGFGENSGTILPAHI